MKRWLVIALLIMSIQQAGAHQAQDTDKHQDTVQQAPTEATVPQGYPNSEPAKNDPQATKGESLCKRLLDAVISNWPLILIGGLGIWAAVRTLGAIEKQVDAMVKSDRAWVMVDLEKTPGWGGIFTGASRSGGGPRRQFVNFSARCVCSNQGQTAARIIEKRCAMILVNGDDELPEPPNLDIEIQDAIPHYLKANGDPWHGDWPLGIEAPEFPAEGKLFVIYGVVRYRHLFSDEIAQTTFGYSLRFDGKLERLIGKPKYNENT